MGKRRFDAIVGAAASAAAASGRESADGRRTRHRKSAEQQQPGLNPSATADDRPGELWQADVVVIYESDPQKAEGTHLPAAASLGLSPTSPYPQSPSASADEHTRETGRALLSALERAGLSSGSSGSSSSPTTSTERGSEGEADAFASTPVLGTGGGGVYFLEGGLRSMQQWPEASRWLVHGADDEEVPSLLSDEGSSTASTSTDAQVPATPPPMSGPHADVAEGIAAPSIERTSSTLSSSPISTISPTSVGSSMHSDAISPRQAPLGTPFAIPSLREPQQGPHLAAGLPSVRSGPSSPGLSPATRRPARPMLTRLDTSERVKPVSPIPNRSDGVMGGSRNGSRGPSPSAGNRQQGFAAPSLPRGEVGAAATSFQDMCRRQAMEPPSPASFGVHSISTRHAPHAPPQSHGLAPPAPLDPLVDVRRASEPLSPHYYSSLAGEMDFSVSCIVPNFLYLGPDIQSEEDVVELEQRGVRRILNMAIEIDEGGREDLGIKRRFETYRKIPMKDTIEATGVQQSIEEACRYIGEHYAGRSCLSGSCSALLTTHPQHPQTKPEKRARRSTCTARPASRGRCWR